MIDIRLAPSEALSALNGLSNHIRHLADAGEHLEDIPELMRAARRVRQALDQAGYSLVKEEVYVAGKGLVDVFYASGRMK